MKVPGPYYRIEVKKVTKRYLNRKFKKHLDPGEVLEGFFDGDKIWITSDDPHIFLHEWFHAWVHQINQYKPDEEAQCDMFANIMCSFFGLESVNEILKKT